MPQRNDLSRCLAAFEQNSTVVAVVEMSQSSCSGPAARLAQFGANTARDRDHPIIAAPAPAAPP